MKKLFTFILSFAMIFTLVPCYASAAEVKQPSYDTLVSKAVAVFPEYAEKMLNSGCRPFTYSDNAPRVLVISKTRRISDMETIIYAEYSDGMILITDDFTCDTTLVSSSTGTTYKNYTVNIEAACIYNGYKGYFYLDSVSYTLRNGVNNFDSITNPGTARKGTNCSNYSRNNYTANESDTGYAQISYRIGFKIGPKNGDIVTSDLTFYVGEDTAVLDHSSWN